MRRVDSSKGPFQKAPRANHSGERPDIQAFARVRIRELAILLVVERLEWGTMPDSITLGLRPAGALRDHREGRVPSWTVYVQTMPPAHAEAFGCNAPLHPIGKIEFDENYSAKIAQVAFLPSHLAPGTEALPRHVCSVSATSSWPSTLRLLLTSCGDVPQPGYTAQPPVAPVV